VSINHFQHLPNSRVIRLDSDKSDLYVFPMRNIVPVAHDSINCVLEFSFGCVLQLFAPNCAETMSQINDVLHLWVLELTEIPGDISCDVGRGLVLSIFNVEVTNSVVFPSLVYWGTSRRNLSLIGSSSIPVQAHPCETPYVIQTLWDGGFLPKVSRRLLQILAE
jgi:hypothetical protein